MTTPPAEHAAFCSAVRAGDEVARMVYADWLEERDDPRGELIRVQVELANVRQRVPCPHLPHASNPEMRLSTGHTCGSCCGTGSVINREWIRLSDRQKELTAALDHRRPVCPVCGGKKLESHSHMPAEHPLSQGLIASWHVCPHCDGKGRVGTWVRGLLSVPVPSLSVVWRVCPECTGGTQWQGTHCDHCRGTGNQCTPWAERLRAGWPWVESVPVLDREPNATEYGMCWRRDTSHHNSTDGIPGFIFDLIDLPGVGSYKHADTPGAAEDALARAAALVLFREGSIPLAAGAG